MQNKKETYIKAIVWYFGFNRAEAVIYMNNASKEMLDGIVDRYNSNAKLAFYND